MVARPRNALSSALSVAVPDFGLESQTVLKVGFLAPLTGKVRSWAEPGWNGCLIWRDRVNAAGGVKVGNRRYMVELVPFDTKYQPDLALRGVKKLIGDDQVKFILMLGGNDFTEQVRDFVNQHRMLVATLLPSDLSPDAPTLVAPSEVHPIYNVTAVEWLKRRHPELQDRCHVRAGRPARIAVDRHLSGSVRSSENRFGRGMRVSGRDDRFRSDRR